MSRYLLPESLADAGFYIANSFITERPPQPEILRPSSAPPEVHYSTTTAGTHDAEPSSTETDDESPTEEPTSAIYCTQTEQLFWTKYGDLVSMLHDVFESRDDLEGRWHEVLRKVNDLNNVSVSLFAALPLQVRFWTPARRFIPNCGLEVLEGILGIEHNNLKRLTCPSQAFLSLTEVQRLFCQRRHLLGNGIMFVTQNLQVFLYLDSFGDLVHLTPTQALAICMNKSPPCCLITNHVAHRSYRKFPCLVPVAFLGILAPADTATARVQETPLDDGSTIWITRVFRGRKILRRAKREVFTVQPHANVYEI